MARKKKDLPLLSGVEILDVAAEGNSIARVDEMVVFIPFGAPGDIADVKIDRKKRSYAEGHIERLTQPSPIRVEAKCEHFTLCGGCRWQHLPYEFQLKCKQKQVEDALQRIAKIPYPELTPILGSEEIWEYRNKMEYTFSNKKWLTFDQLRSGEEFPERRAAGFHISGAFDKVLDINKCHLQDDLGNRLRLFVKKFGMDNDYSFYDLREQHGLLRTLMIRIASTGEVMAVMVFGENDEEKIGTLLSAVAAEFPEITSLLYVVNTKVNDTISDQAIHLYRGKEYIEEEMEGLRFRVGPKSFYQTNSRQAYRIPLLFNPLLSFYNTVLRDVVISLPKPVESIFFLPKQHIFPEILHVFITVVDRDLKRDINGIYRFAVLFQDLHLVICTCRDIIDIQKTVRLGISPLCHFKNPIFRNPDKSHGLL